MERVSNETRKIQVTSGLGFSNKLGFENTFKVY